MNSMECGCSCDFDEYPKFFRAEDFTARKEYRCCECKGTIHIGDKYEYATGLWDNEFSIFKTCLTCCNIRRDFCAAFTYLRETVWEVTGVDYVTGEIQEDEDD